MSFGHTLVEKQKQGGQKRGERRKSYAARQWEEGRHALSKMCSVIFNSVPVIIKEKKYLEHESCQFA